MEQDPVGRNVPGLGLGRDPERTPMQWDATLNAGFTTGSPWLPISKDWRSRNVATQKDDPSSILSLHRRLIALRQSESALIIGSYRPVPAGGDVLAYIREHDATRFLVALNFGAEKATLSADGLVGTVEISTQPGRDREAISTPLTIRPNEGLVVRLSG
jgi:alpha-glucosidase